MQFHFALERTSDLTKLGNKKYNSLKKTIYLRNSLLCLYMWFYSAFRCDEMESQVGLDGSLVQHGGEYESKGVPAMLERLCELPEGEKFWVHCR
jgi:hypothetical protein